MNPSQKKIRIDKLLTDRGLAPSRERAQAFILAGLVYVGTQRVTKASELFVPEAPIELKGHDHPYVSRGGVKLAGALDYFQIDVDQMNALDVGASTGGFTDCLLQRGAKKVFALDVGYGQLAWKIRCDPRVVVMEKKNVRELKTEEISDLIHLIVVDVSFISLTQVIPPLLKIFSPRSLDQKPPIFLSLIKPQFEVGKGKVPKGGVITDDRVRQEVVAQLAKKIEEWGAQLRGVAPCIIQGADGNQEYFVFFEWPGKE